MRRTQFRQKLAQRVLFGAAELGLAGFTKDLLDAALFTRLDPLVQILKEPIQLPSQSAAGAAFARAHESDQKNCPRRPAHRRAGCRRRIRSAFHACQSAGPPGGMVSVS
jgi:hypothetical protein